MPVAVKQIEGLFRIVEEDGSISMTKKRHGHPAKQRDGGGYALHARASAQVNLMNRIEARKGNAAQL